MEPYTSGVPLLAEMLIPWRVLLVTPDMLSCWFVGRLGRCGYVEELLVS